MHTLALNVALVLTTAGSPNIYNADRADLFTTCAKMPEYTIDRRNGPVRQVGTWSFSTNRQAGASIILDIWKTYGDSDPNHLAYVLATARRESAGTFRPIAEADFCGKDEGCRERAIGRMQAERTAKINAERIKNGLPPLSLPRNYTLPDAQGRRWYGRGFNQLTHAADYRKTGLRVGVDLENNPDALLEPNLSARVLIEGLLRGWYGSRKPLSFYINDQKQDWVAARDTTNPKSPNKTITAAIAKDFRRCLKRSS